MPTTPPTPAAQSKAAAKEKPEELSGADLFESLKQSSASAEVSDFVDSVYAGQSGSAGLALSQVLPWIMQNAPTLSGRASDMIEGMIAQIDEVLTTQINEILHAPEFQKLEGSWRGLHRLVHESHLSTDLKIFVFNVSKDELRDTFRTYVGGKWDESPVFKKIYEDRFGVFGGEPMGTIVGDYQFGTTQEDVEVLRGLSKIAAAAHAPFVGSASASAFKLDSWKDVTKIPDPTMLFDGDEYAVWRAFRRSEDSKYVGLVLPRVLARRPYGKGGETVKDFAFEEDVSGDGEGKFAWTNASLVMAENINRSFYQHGWASEICGVGDNYSAGGVVSNLPVYTYTTDDGSQDMTCPTEIALPYAREAVLSGLGFIPLCHQVGENNAAFFSANSVHQPQEFHDPQDNKNAQLTARLPYLFAVSRFAHFLKKMVYLKIGLPMPRAAIERWLNDWISNYVLLNAENVSDYALLAEKPLSAARVEVVEDEANPGFYRARFFLQPHFRLERIDVSLRLVSKLPETKR